MCLKHQNKASNTLRWFTWNIAMVGLKHRNVFFSHHNRVKTEFRNHGFRNSCFGNTINKNTKQASKYTSGTIWFSTTFYYFCFRNHGFRNDGFENHSIFHHIKQAWIMRFFGRKDEIDRSISRQSLLIVNCLLIFPHGGIEKAKTK